MASPHCAGWWHHLITATSAPVQTTGCCFLWSSGLTWGPYLTFQTELECLHLQAVFINLTHNINFEINSLNVLVLIVPDLKLAHCAVMIRLEALVPCTGELWPGLAES